MLKVRKGGGEEIPLVQGKEQRLHFAGAAVKRYPTPKARGGGREDQPHVVAVQAQEGLEELSRVQGKKQWLCFAGAAVKRYHTSKVRETQIRQ